MSILSDYKGSKSSIGALAKELREVLDDSDLEWEEKYDVIFRAHQSKVLPALKAAGIRLDWYDPDTTYEEDARAYVEAVEALVSRRS